jgi:hypothetical protein
MGHSSAGPIWARLGLIWVMWAAVMAPALALPPSLVLVLARSAGDRSWRGCVSARL